MWHATERWHSRLLVTQPEGERDIHFARYRKQPWLETKAETAFNNRFRRVCVGRIICNRTTLEPRKKEIA